MADETYYMNLEKEVNEQKLKDPKRGSKKTIKYMENADTRRSTFSKRSETLILNVRITGNFCFKDIFV